MTMDKFETVDDYISAQPEKTREVLNKLRKTIKGLAPEAKESMSYGMPGYKLKKKPLIYFAGWKDHVGIYPTPGGMDAFETELKPYRTGKGTAQFPLDQPFPYELIKKILKFRIEEAKK